MADPKEYRYRGALITVKMAAQMAGVSEWSIYDRLKKNGGDMEMAIHGGGKSEAQIAEEKILAALGYDEPSARMENSGAQLRQVKVMEPPQYPAPEGAEERVRAASEPGNAVPVAAAAKTIESPATTAVPAMDAADKNELRILNRAIKALEAVEFIELDDDSNVLLDDALQRLRRIRRELFDECVDWEAMAR